MRSNTNIPRNLQEKVDREIESGERIQWIGMAIPQFYTPITTIALLSAIVLTAPAISWIVDVSDFKLSDFNEGRVSSFPLFAVPFVLIGLGILSSPLWLYRNACKTAYARRGLYPVATFL